MAGLVLKRQVKRFPVLAPGSNQPHYYKLWGSILNGLSTCAPLARRSPIQAPLKLLQAPIESHLARKEQLEDQNGIIGDDFFRQDQASTTGSQTALTKPVIVKSVHAVGAASWLSAHFNLNVLWIRRHPLAILASWLRMQLPDRHRFSLAGYFPALGGSHSTRLSEADIQSVNVLAALLKVQQMQIQDNPEWIIEDFENLCLDPQLSFQALFKEIGVAWSPACEASLQASQKPGSGFQTNRIAQQQTNKWTSELEPELISHAYEVFSALQIEPYWDNR